MERTDEEVLIALAKTGDQQALSRLLAQEEGRLLNFSRRMCGNAQDAEDVLQEAMLSASRSIEGFREDARLSTWLFRIARNACFKMRQKRTPLADDPDHVPERIEHLTPEDEAHRTQLRALIDQSLHKLTPAQREVVLLRDVYGFSAPEVVQITGLGLTAVKSRLHRGRSVLATELEALTDLFAPPQPDCPSLFSRWSKMREDDLDARTCAQMRAHMAHCEACRKRCDTLQTIFETCQLLDNQATEGVHA